MAAGQEIGYHAQGTALLPPDETTTTYKRNTRKLVYIPCHSRHFPLSHWPPF